MICHPLALHHLLVWCSLERAAWHLRLTTDEDRPSIQLARMIATTMLGEEGLRACKAAA